MHSTVDVRSLRSDTQEQIRRNSVGRFGSLDEFARRHSLDTKGRIFAHCRESGDIVEPKIDLSGKGNYKVRSRDFVDNYDIVYTRT